MELKNKVDTKDIKHQPPASTKHQNTEASKMRENVLVTGVLPMY